MREIKKIFNVYYDKLGIKSNLIYGDESVIFGKTLMPEESTSFNFLYKGKNCQAIIEGKGENVKALIELLKATFSYSDSQTIKDKKDYVLKTLLGISGSKEYNQKYNLNYNSCVVMVISSKKSSKEICSFLPLYTNCLPVEIDKGLCAFINKRQTQFFRKRLYSFAAVVGNYYKFKAAFFDFKNPFRNAGKRFLGTMERKGVVRIEQNKFCSGFFQILCGDIRYFFKPIICF